MKREISIYLYWYVATHDVIIFPNFTLSLAVVIKGRSENPWRTRYLPVVIGDRKKAPAIKHGGQQSLDEWIIIIFQFSLFVPQIYFASHVIYCGSGIHVFLSFSSFSYHFMTFCCSLRPGLLPLSYTSCHFSIFHIYGFHLLPFHFLLLHYLFRLIPIILVLLFLIHILPSFVFVHLLTFLFILTTTFWLLWSLTFFKCLLHLDILVCNTHTRLHTCTHTYICIFKIVRMCRHEAMLLYISTYKYK